METGTTIPESDLTSPEVIPPLQLPRTRWIGWSLLIGLLVAIPSGWLLAYLAALPFFLGMFFFLLLGLMIGAVMFRVGSKAPEPSARTLWMAGTAVTAAALLISLWAEYQALPRSVEKRIRESYAGSFTPEMWAELRTGVRDFIPTELQNRYPPGGFLGYLRWAATSGKLDCPRISKAAAVEYRMSQRGTVWAIRVALSLLMLEWTIMSQLLGLRPSRRQDASGDVEQDAAAQTPGTA
jgi:hypothetical protein